MPSLPGLVSSLALYLSRKPAAEGPCDIYEAGGTPCVAAHSTTRALYGSYSGRLYEVIRGSDNATADISTLHKGGVANAATQDAFCHLTTCLIRTIYDQSEMENHLTVAPGGGAATGPQPGGFDFLASAVGAPVKLNGQKAYGVFSTLATGYRNDKTKGVATGNDPEGMYAVMDGTHYKDDCCFDYGNAELNDLDNGKTYMETIYFGSSHGTARGAGTGPWVMADLENGIFAGNQSGSVNPNNPSIDYRFVTGIVKGDSSNLWAIRGGNSQEGDLSTFYSGPRPPGYYPMHKEGAILLGIGGDNSDRSQGTFYEGAMTTGYPDDETENKVHANIVAAGYETSSLIGGPSINTDAPITIQSVNNHMYIGHDESEVILSASSGPSSTFNVRPGNSNGVCYSFEAVDAPGTFLRHHDFQLYCDKGDTSRAPDTFADDSTFCPEAGFVGGGTSMRSFSYPTRYWRSDGGDEVTIGMNGGPFIMDNAEDFVDETVWHIAQASCQSEIESKQDIYPLPAM